MPFEESKDNEERQEMAEFVLNAQAVIKDIQQVIKIQSQLNNGNSE